MFPSSCLFLQKDEKRGSERLKFHKSKLDHRFVTDVASGFSTSAFLFHLFKDEEKTLLCFRRFCLVSVYYAPRDSPTKDTMEVVVVLLWGIFVCFLTSFSSVVPPPFKYLCSPAICWHVCFSKISACGLQVWGQLKRALKRTPKKNVTAQLCVSQETLLCISSCPSHCRKCVEPL